MTIHVDPIEAAWIAMNTAAVVVTGASFVEAFRRWMEARRLNGSHKARRLVAGSNTRREALRGTVQLLLLSLVTPGLFIDRPTTLNPFTGALIAISVVLLVQTVLDTRDRYRLNDLLEDAVPVSAVALEASVQEGNDLTREGIAAAKIAAEKSAEAIDIGNHSREALIRLTEIVGGKEDKPVGEA